VSPLEQAIARRIRLQGPISVAAFMAEALGHPEHGYYMKADPLGARAAISSRRRRSARCSAS
jgi:NADH dehydrogenase [ubiquinone] 1 alpha subcomplex assembly factor 7